MNRLLGAVLAGGRSTRFGSDKAQADLGGHSLLSHATEALARHVDRIVICGRDVGGMTCLADRPTPGLGPLGGINAALHHARENGFAAVMTTGCDMPRFPDELADALVGEGPAVLSGQHLAGFWPVALADDLDRHLAATNNRSLLGWIDRLDVRIITLPDIIMPNVNRVSDLEALAKELRDQP